MKISALFLSLLCFSSLHSQTFDRFFSDTWSCNASLNETELRATKGVALLRVHDIKMIQEDCVIWKFHDGWVSLFFIDAEHKEDSLVGKYSYELDKTDGVLSIFVDKGEPLQFATMMISTGGFTMLTKLTEKEMAKRKRREAKRG